MIFAKAKTEKKTRRVEARVPKSNPGGICFDSIQSEPDCLFADITFPDDLAGRDALSLIVFRHRIVCSAFEL
jgi:hypothetical protein